MALRVVAPPATGTSTLARLGAKAVLVEPGERAKRFARVESKLAAPTAGPSSVSRTALVNRLRALADLRVVSIVAPAGYGKTTVCAQWAARDGRACAWLTVDERDNDPDVFVRHVAAALEQATGLESGSLGEAGDSVWDAALPRLWAALTALREPLLLVLDDACLIDSTDGVSVLELLAGHLAPGSTLAVTGRRASRLPLARLRVAGELAEVGAADLRLSARETALVARALGVELDAEQLAEVHGRSEGWPAGVHVLATAPGRLEPGPPPGSEAALLGYFRAEAVAGLTAAELAFARRTAILDRLSGPLCRAVLAGARGAARRLEALVDRGAFLSPLDKEPGWYRYHPLFREFLRHELETDEPELVPELYRRAAAWYEAQGDAKAAVGAAQAAGDTGRAAHLVGSEVVAAYCAGELAAAGEWFDALAETDDLERQPALAAAGAWIAAARGRTSDAERLLGWADRRKRGALPDGTPLAPLVALVRAALCRDGLERMREDAEAAVSALPPASGLRPSALALRAVALFLAGEPDAADDAFGEAAQAAETVGALDAHALALAERSLIASARGDHAAAETFARRAGAIVEQAGLEQYPARAVQLVASARAALRHGRWDEANALVGTAAEAVPRLTAALPWLAVQVRVELVRVHVALRDTAGARAVLGELRELVGRRPGLGVLAAQAGELERELVRDAQASGSSLTAAELRLLPLLATHLSFREIGERLFVSRNTIKTQAISVYRKLGVSTRSAAIARAEYLGLVEAGAAAGDFTPSA